MRAPRLTGLIAVALRAVIGWQPPRWLRPKPEGGEADVPALVSPDPPVAEVRQNVGVDFASLTPEKQAEFLQKQVRVAAVRNQSAVEAVQRQATEVQKFETRARETLRDLLDDMGRSDDGSRR